MRSVMFVIAFTLGAMYLPTTYSAILVGSAIVVIILGVLKEVNHKYQQTKQRFWDALERPQPPLEDEDGSGFIPYITTRYRRLKP